jgi:hypothetical protein
MYNKYKYNISIMALNIAKLSVVYGECHLY